MPPLKHAALILAVLLLVVACGGGKSTGIVHSPAPASAAQSSSTATATSASSPGKSGAQGSDAFACTDQRSGGTARAAQLTAVRVAHHTGFDRVTFQFDARSGVPTYRVLPQASAEFVHDASGLPLRLEGAAGVGIVFQGSSGIDLGSTPVKQTYTGSRDIKAGLPLVRELAQLGDFERVLSWGVGLSSAPCIRMIELSNPARLVIDIRAAPTSGPAPSHGGGPYATREAAEQFVKTQPPVTLSLISPETSWRSDATLHVLHATYEGGAAWAGDWYYFFVHGYDVGKQYFAHSSTTAAIDDRTFAISYDVYRQGDPQCCPSGGTATVRFQWNGSSLVTLDPIPGPVMVAS